MVYDCMVIEYCASVFSADIEATANAPRFQRTISFLGRITDYINFKNNKFL